MVDNTSQYMYTTRWISLMTPGIPYTLQLVIVTLTLIIIIKETFYISHRYLIDYGVFISMR